MGNRDLVPLPATTLTRRSRPAGLLPFGVILLASALCLLVAHSLAPEPLVTAAVPEAGLLPEPKVRSAPDGPEMAVPILPPPPTVEAVEPPLPRARPVPPLPGTGAGEPRSTQGPVPSQGWLLEQEELRQLPAGAGAPRTLVTYMNRDIDGSDYQAIGNQRLAGCESLCKSDGRCRAYTFNTWENVCFLKSSATVTRIEPRGISGVLASEEVRAARRPPTIERFRSRRFPGHPYRSLDAADFDGCARACAADPLCLGFNFGKPDRACSLMASLDRTVAGEGIDAGMKWQAPIVASASPRRRALPPPRDLPPEAAIIFGVVRQMMRY